MENDHPRPARPPKFSSVGPSIVTGAIAKEPSGISGWFMLASDRPSRSIGTILERVIFDKRERSPSDVITRLGGLLQ